jgi:hypothetical protein
LLTGCKKKQIQIRELDFYDYIYAENTRVKGYLVNNSSKDLYNLEKYLYNCTKKILSKEFHSSTGCECRIRLLKSFFAQAKIYAAIGKME